jgi:hypothetical protein
MMVRERKPPRQECQARISQDSIIVECGRCPGEGSLGNGRCLQAFLDAVPPQASFEQVVLRRSVEIRYQRGAVMLLKGAADVIWEYGQLYRDRSRACHKCAFRPSAVARRLVLSRWGNVHVTLRRPGRRACAACAGLTQELVQELERRLRILESRALAETLIAKDG